MTNNMKVGSILLMIMIFCLIVILPVQASTTTKDQINEIKITRIKLNKKTIKIGGKMVSKINIKCNKKIKSLKVYFVGPFYYGFNYISKEKMRRIVSMKPTNRSRTIWKGSFKVTQNMISGTWGIGEVHVKLKNGKKHYIYNSRWTLNDGRKDRQNLSSGNFKVKKH